MKVDPNLGYSNLERLQKVRSRTSAQVNVGNLHH
jgi:hypothetical protein